jgi:hypothetical protein
MPLEVQIEKIGDFRKIVAPVAVDCRFIKNGGNLPQP